jgi:hypothetical protein
MNTLNRAKQLQARTKKFAVRIIKAFARLPKEEAIRIIERHFSEQALRSRPTIVRVVGRVQLPTSFPR